MEDQDVNPGVLILKRLECVMERTASSHGDDVSMQERVKEQYQLMMELGAVLKRSEDRSRVMEQRNKNLLNENQELYAKNAKNKDRLAQHHKKVRSLQESALKHAAVEKQYEELLKVHEAAAVQHAALAEEHAITEKEYGILINEHEQVKKQKEDLIERLEVTATQKEELMAKLEVVLKEKEQLEKQVAEGSSVQESVVKETVSTSTSTDDLVDHADVATETSDADPQLDIDSVILTRSEMDHLEEGMQALKACIRQREKTWGKLEKKERNQRSRITRLESEVLNLREMGHLARQELENKAVELKEKKAAAKQDQKEIAALRRQIVRDRHRGKPERSRRYSYDDTMYPPGSPISPRDTPVSSREGPVTPRKASMSDKEAPVSYREGTVTPRKVPLSPRQTRIPSREAPAVSPSEAVSPVPTIVDIIGKAVASPAPPELAYNKSVKAAVTPTEGGISKIVGTPVKSSISRRSKVTSLSSAETVPSAGPRATPSNKLIKVAVTTPKATAPLELPYNRRSRLPVPAPTAAKPAVSSSLRETPGKMALNSGVTRNSALPKTTAVRRPGVEGAGYRAPFKRTTTSAASGKAPHPTASENVL